MADNSASALRSRQKDAVDLTRDSSRPSVLILSATFPPRGGSGVQRPYYQFRLLSELGHSAWVVTASNHAAWVRDDSFSLSESEKDRVICLPMFRTRMMEHLSTRIVKRARFLMYPGRAAYWRRRAQAAASALIDLHGIDCVISSVGSPCTLQIMANLKRQYPQLATIADFRDLWAGNPVTFGSRSQNWKLYQFLDSALERKWLRNVDAVLSVSPTHCRILSGRYSDLIANGAAIRVLHNGYDEERYSSVVASRPSQEERFIFRYTGFVLPSMRLRDFFATVSKAVAADPVLRRRIKFEFYTGTASVVQQTASECGISDIVASKPYVPHAQVPELQATADALLVMWTPDPGCMCGKFYEYLRAGPPVLAISQGNPDGESVLVDTGRGEACSIDDPSSIISAMKRFVDGRASYTCRRNLVEQYSRQSQATQLSALISAACSRYSKPALL
jgi:glycosyltransferase involved in cell wall biosynthesis